MLNISILLLAIDGAAVGDLRVLKLEVVAIKDLLIVFVENFEKSGLILNIALLVELAEGEEVLAVHPVVLLVRQREGAEIKGGLRG